MTDNILSINQVCRLLNISKNTYYNSRSPYKRIEEKYKDLKLKILDIIKNNPAYGYPRIKKALEIEYNLTINHKLLIKLLKIWGLSLPRKLKRHKKSLIYDILDFIGLKSNLLRSLIKRKIKIECFKVILSDFTEIIYSGKKIYLCVHMDYSGKYIFGWNLSESPDHKFVLSSADKAIRCLKKFKISDFSKIIFHQDRGTVYTSENYVSYLLKFEINISYSRKGEPGDNAVNESFFSRLKDEWRDLFSELKNISEVKKEMKKVIEYYNEKRYHTSIGYKTPLAYILERLNT